MEGAWRVRAGCVQGVWRVCEGVRGCVRGSKGTVDALRDAVPMHALCTAWRGGGAHVGLLLLAWPRGRCHLRHREVACARIVPGKGV